MTDIYTFDPSEVKATLKPQDATDIRGWVAGFNAANTLADRVLQQTDAIPSEPSRVLARLGLENCILGGLTCSCNADSVARRFDLAPDMIYGFVEGAKTSITANGAILGGQNV